MLFYKKGKCSVTQYSASEPYFLWSESLWTAAVRVCLETGMPPVFGKEDGKKPREATGTVIIADERSFFLSKGGIAVIRT